jgi:hypothetical protein
METEKSIVAKNARIQVPPRKLLDLSKTQKHPQSHDNPNVK